MKGELTLQKLCHKTKLYLTHNSSTILTCIGAVGVVATAVAAVKATPKAISLLADATDEKGEKLTKVETAVVAAPAYIPSAIIGASTIACIFGANALNKRQQAALTSAYALLDSTFKEYKNKVKELYGEDGELQVRDEIVKDNLKDKGSVSDDKQLFWDEYSNRYFESTLVDVQSAEYHFNRNFILRGYATLNEFYEFLGIAEMDNGDNVGWSSDIGFLEYGYRWVDFDHRLVVTDDGLECYIISMPFGPTSDFLD